MRITTHALRSLAMLNSSCRTFQDKKIGNLKYLVKLAQSGKEIEFEDLMKSLPEKSDMYRSIQAFVAFGGQSIISNTQILKFYGGLGHIEFVLDQARMLEMNGKSRDNFVFAHALLPIEIQSVGKDNRVGGTYSNGSIRVGVENLLLHPLIPARVNSGDLVLTHYAMIVGINPGLDFSGWLVDEHMKNEDFMSIAGRILEIDYEKFWDLRKWSQDILKEADLLL